MDPEGQLRNLRDFLLVYNRMTEICFQRCTNNFNYRNLTMDEERCADSCAGKLVRCNHRLMGTYVQLMPAMVQRRMEELESKAGEIAKATEVGGSVEPLAGSLKSSDASSNFATPTPGVLAPTSAAEQAGISASNGTPTPPLSTNKTLDSVDHIIPVVTVSAHTAAAEPPVVESSRQASLDVTSPLLNPSVPARSRNVDVNHIGVVNSSISPIASAHRSTGGEAPPP